MVNSLLGRRRLAGVLSIGLACLLVGAGCGSSSGGKASAPTSGAASSSAATPSEVSGQAVTIGFLGGDAAGLGNPSLDPAARAAVAYENSIGGVHGRPLKVVTCDDEGTPESVTSCANIFLSDKVLAVGTRLTTNEPQILTPLAAKGIPFVTQVPTGPSFASPDAIAVSPVPITGLLAAGLYGSEHGLDSSVVVFPNSPASQQIVDLIVPMYKQLGVQFSDQLVNPGTADLTPAISAATRTNPKTITITGGNAFCVSGLKAAKAIGYHGKVFVAACAGPEFVKAAGSLLNGTIGLEADTYAMTPSARATYIGAMKKYARGVDPAADLAPVAFSTISLIASVLRTLPTSSPYTSSALLSAMKGLKDYTYPFDFQMPLTCDGSVTTISQFKSICSTQLPYYTYKNGSEVFLGLMDFSHVFGK